LHTREKILVEKKNLAMALWWGEISVKICMWKPEGKLHAWKLVLCLTARDGEAGLCLEVERNRLS
jgi:hypothetical protein